MKRLVLAMLLASSGAYATEPTQAEVCAKLEKKMSRPGYWAAFGAGLAAGLANQHTATVYTTTRINGETYRSSGSVTWTDHYGAQRDAAVFNDVLQDKRMKKLKAKWLAAGCAPVVMAAAQ